MPAAIKFSNKQMQKLQKRVEVEQILKEKRELKMKHTYQGHLIIRDIGHDFEYIVEKEKALKISEAQSRGVMPKVVNWQFNREGENVWGELTLKGTATTICLEIRIRLPRTVSTKEIVNIEWPWPHNGEE